jgi:hypothetical protein
MAFLQNNFFQDATVNTANIIQVQQDIDEYILDF